MDHPRVRTSPVKSIKPKINFLCVYTQPVNTKRVSDTSVLDQTENMSSVKPYSALFYKEHETVRQHCDSVKPKPPPAAQTV